MSATTSLLYFSLGEGPGEGAHPSLSPSGGEGDQGGDPVLSRKNLPQKALSPWG